MIGNETTSTNDPTVAVGSVRHVGVTTHESIPEVQVVSSPSEGGGRGHVPTPEQLAQQAYYESRKKKEDALKTLFTVLYWFIPMAVSIITLVATAYIPAYVSKLEKLLIPISALQERSEADGGRLNSLEQKVDMIDDRISNTREEFLRE